MSQRRKCIDLTLKLLFSQTLGELPTTLFGNKGHFVYQSFAGALIRLLATVILHGSSVFIGLRHYIA